MKQENLKKRFAEGRKIEFRTSGIHPSNLGQTGDESFSLIELLRGKWTSPAQGWNLIALPFSDPSAKFGYRLLMNQYGETLNFEKPDKNVPNRGIHPDAQGNTDQLIDAIDYQQLIFQVDAEDSPPSDKKANNGDFIHHEPGFFMQMLNHAITENGKELNIARSASIPHGDSVMALGDVQEINGAPIIPAFNALPRRENTDLQNNPYLQPYKHFEDHKFFGTVNPNNVPDFPGFFSTNANAILAFANPGNQGQQVKKTTILHFDTHYGASAQTPGGIVNIPFVVREANATKMRATFWIMELEQEDDTQPKEFVMQYSQIVFLDFFPSKEEPGKLISWPHVSINTLRKIE